MEHVKEANDTMRHDWQLADAQLELRELPSGGGVELRSQRIFLDPPVVDAALKVASNAQPVLTYLVNELRDKDKCRALLDGHGHGRARLCRRTCAMTKSSSTNGSRRTSTPKPTTGCHWLYYVIGNGRALETRTNEFRVRAIVPLSGAAADRTLMPDFPGIAEAETTQNWDAGFPIETGKIRYKDEEYWKQYRGTPKAFVTLAAGRKMWANRFGDCTAIRFPASAGSLETIRSNLCKRSTRRPWA